MNFEWIESFVTVAQHRSLSKASEVLNMTQPAVSKQIRKLEEMVGAQLLNRSYAGIRLTEKGERFLHEAQPMLISWERIRDDIVSDVNIREVTIVTLPYISNFYLPRVIVKLREKSIEVHIKVMDHSEEIWDCVRSGNAKLAILDSRYINGPIWQKALFQNSYHAIIPSTHRLAGKGGLTLMDLKDENFVVFPYESDITKNIMAEFDSRQWKLKINEVIRFDQAIIPFVGVGFGVTLLPAVAVSCPFMVMAESSPIIDYRNQTTFSLISSSESLGEYISGMIS